MNLKTIYISNIPIDCHIVKGRLESDGLDVFIYDENIVWIHPFRAVAIGGVKLMVPVDQVEKASAILNAIDNNKLIDENGHYDLQQALNTELARQNEMLDLKYNIRHHKSMLDNVIDIKSEILSQSDIKQTIMAEKEFAILKRKSVSFTWKQFFYELFDFERSVFKYLRPRPAEYYLDKELVDSYHNQSHDKPTVICHKCKSDNVSYGYAIDYKWDILYLILSILFIAPFPLIRKKYHCFNCGNDFNKKQNI